MSDIELGGNIKLVGFREVDTGSMVILKKIIGNYTRKISDCDSKFERLEITLKKIHDTGEGSHPKYEIQSKAIIGGQVRASEFVDRNLFVGVDSSLKKILNEINH